MWNEFRFPPVESILAAAVMAFLALAAVLKLIDLPEFQRSLDTWSLVPPSVRPVAALFIPAGELAISVAWLLGIQRRRMVFAAMGMLVLFTLAYLGHLIWMDAPTCNCLGVLSRYLGDKQSTFSVLARNAILVGLLALSLWLGRKRGQPSPSKDDVVSHAISEPSNARGFSLIELLLVIVIIAVLISLLAPSLKLVKDRAERVAAFSRFSSHGKAFIAYTADYKDTWPYLTDPNATWTILRAPHIDMGVEYWDIYCWWHVPLSELLYKLPWTDVSFRQNRRDLPGPTPFWYSSAFIADPTFFVPSSRVGRQQWRATRVNEVLFPSRKALLVNGGAWDDGKKADSPLSMLFADGSAQDVPSNATLGWDPNGTGWWNPGGGFFAPIAGMTTLEGVRGRDRQ